MSAISIGDMARAFQLRHLQAGLRSDLDRLGRELSTGQKSDTASGATRDFAPVVAIERSLAALGAYKTSSAEAALTVESAQASLGVVQDLARDVFPVLVQVSSTQNRIMNLTIAADVRSKFSTVVAALNTSAGGRTVLAGAATDGPAIADADTLLTEILAVAAGETTASGVLAAVDDWFDTPGGGFETSGYLGSDKGIGPVPVGEGEIVEMTAAANHPAVRNVLKAFVAGALVAGGVLDGTGAEQAKLLEMAGLRMIGADGELSVLRAEIGSAQARIENASARNQAETAALEIARSELVAVDPYETASRLQAAYDQLETLYAVTARLSRLNFTDYLK
jgi:flagellar hook-associated protein 3 FlgL